MNSKKNQSNAIDIIAANQPQSYAAYVATRAEREAVSEADAAAAAMNIEFGAAVSLALATQRRAMPLRDLIAKWVPRLGSTRSAAAPVTATSVKT